MRDYHDDIVAALSKAELSALRCVYEWVCVEFEVSRNGKGAQDVANFVMAEFRRPSDESAFLAAARAFSLNRQN
ncbi:hypothetical protein SM0020_30267 [Sinorhizobium meliloti CCNWSX0020]|uniref:Uncharacterized protein n=1 Tax=Sinorhizobium meliloti CCNWSX0020 TaxID=1107881 RepID=H0G948_RHIML|nr:hypothetical protein [Sinorhizobium meliloti]EHK74144.1 hypothetical protein SM0020_30267 [Sinorhizobium meliloti CCNWSX0020]